MWFKMMKLKPTENFDNCEEIQFIQLDKLIIIMDIHFYYINYNI